jgi:hypothetical protein
MRDDIRPTRRTFVFGAEVHSSMASAAPTIVPAILVSTLHPRPREVDKLLEESVVVQRYAESATPKE